MADINHEIKTNAAPQAVYQALTTASELAKWHTSRTENGNGKKPSLSTPRTVRLSMESSKAGCSHGGVAMRCRPGRLCGDDRPLSDLSAERWPHPD